MRKTIFLVLLGCSVIVLTGTPKATNEPAIAKTITPLHPNDFDPLTANAIVGHKGGIFGVAADARVRAFLNETGLPH